MVQVDRVPRVRVPVPRGVDRAPPQLLRLRVREVEAVALVEHAVRERGARADGEDVALDARAVRVDVEDRGPGFVPAADHRALE